MRYSSSYRPLVDYVLFIVLAYNLVFVVVVETVSVCDGPFSDFLRCSATNTDARLDKYSNEIQPTIQSSIQQCFLQYKCSPPDFSKATLDFFVQEPWTSRLNAILNVMETMDPKVQRCMTDYFKGQLAKRVNECVKKNGPPDVKDFEMPPIPGGYNVDIPTMKRVILQRMMVQYQFSQCASAATDDASKNNLIRCIRTARQEADPTAMCLAREQCVRSTIRDNRCVDRYTKIRQAACKCFADDEGKKQMQDQMQHMLINGALEKQFKECHATNNVPYPIAKVDEAKKQARAAFGDILSGGGIPAGVKEAMKVGKQVMTEMSQQWKTGFCSDCAAGDGAKTSPIAPVALPQPAPQTAQVVPPPVPASSVVSNGLPAVPAGTLSGGNGVSSSSSSSSQQTVAGGGTAQFVIPPPLPPHIQAQQPLTQQGLLDFQSNLARVFGPASNANG